MTKPVRTIAELAAAGLTSPDRLARLEEVASRYAVAITPAVAATIDPSDPSDPIARQYVPSPAELATEANERLDPIGDDAHSPVEGVVHRYPDRVLLKAIHVCAVYCRFCFRRETVGPGRSSGLSRPALERALDYIAAHEEIWEVILSGGDPLLLGPGRLGHILRRLGGIRHVKVVRVHTRLPVADPRRITPELVAALGSGGKATWIVLHANHARELTEEARSACARLVDSGMPMLSQSVLLRGVNDDPAALAALLRALVETRVKPYYLHHGDLAPGTAHLRTTIAEGQALMTGLRGRVSGLCQPSYVLDIPGGHGKSPIGPGYLRGGEGDYTVSDWQGGTHRYPPIPDRRLEPFSPPDALEQN